MNLKINRIAIEHSAGAQSYSKHTETGARSKESSGFRGRQAVLTSALNSLRILGKPRHLSRASVCSSVKGAKREGQGRGAATRPESLAQSPAQSASTLPIAMTINISRGPSADVRSLKVLPAFSPSRPRGQTRLQRREQEVGAQGCAP